MIEDPPKKYNNVVQKKWWQKIFQGPIDYNELLDRTIISNVVDP